MAPRIKLSMQCAVLIYIILNFFGQTSTFDDNPGATPTGPHGMNLEGKMFNLSSGGVSCHTQHSTTNSPQTSAPPTKGVSVCLGYHVEDELKATKLTIFTLSPSRSPLILESSDPGRYALHICVRNTWGSGYNCDKLLFKPHIKCLPNVQLDDWTRLCLTVDTVKNVAQVFSGSKISFENILPNRYVWPGEPVIDFPRFDGQVTDVQIWDKPIRYIEIYNFMTGAYGPNRGSVLTWSSISFSPRGNVLLEDVYEQQAKHPISSAQKRGHPKRKKAARVCSDFKRKMFFP